MVEITGMVTVKYTVALEESPPSDVARSSHTAWVPEDRFGTEPATCASLHTDSAAATPSNNTRVCPPP
jgi:hypothetical protein